MVKGLDIFRQQFRVIDPDKMPEVPTAVRTDMRSFLGAVSTDEINLENFGIRGHSLDTVLGELRRRYCGT